MTEDQLLQFQAQGFLHVPGVVSGAMLARLRAAFEAAAHRYADQWPASSPLLYFDIPQPLDQDDVFVDLADIDPVFYDSAYLLAPDKATTTRSGCSASGPSATARECSAVL